MEETSLSTGRPKAVDDYDYFIRVWLQQKQILTDFLRMGPATVLNMTREQTTEQMARII